MTVIMKLLYLTDGPGSRFYKHVHIFLESDDESDFVVLIGHKCIATVTIRKL